jgi:uncharacterized protein (TIGR03435 family)
MKFDVVSVRENKAVRYETGSTNPPHASYFVAKNLSAEFLTEWGYGLRRWQILGAPDWFNTAAFYIEAKGDSANDERLASLSEEQASAEKVHMIRTLLEERFKLQTHWETRQQPVYALVVAKGGAKLLRGGSSPVSASEAAIFGDETVRPIRQNWESSGMEFFAHECSMDWFAHILSGQMGMEVVNHTGLSGTYDFKVKYNGAQPDDRPEDPSKWPPLVFAVEDQLGLKLEHARGDVKVLVIDHVERPTEN